MISGVLNFTKIEAWVGKGESAFSANIFSDH